MAPSVSLIITSYNRSAYLAATIESVLKQTYTDFELLLWDDGSTDLSPQIARYYALRDPRIRVKAAQHQGVASTLKAAIAATTGHYIGWVDSDDLLASTALEQTVAILDAHPSVGMVYTNYRVIDQQGHDRGLGKRCRIPYSPEKLLVDFMTFHFRLIRRTVYNQVGGIDASYQRAEDYDLCLRLSEVTEFRHLPQPLYFYRRHADNLTNDTLELIRWSHQASTQALHRRGLDQGYTIDLQISSKFQLKRKSTVVNHSPQEPTATTPVHSTPEPNHVLLKPDSVTSSLTNKSSLNSTLDSLPLVSIIVPTYNRKHCLSRSLESIIRQTYSNYEVIVVDDGSTDGTSAWLQAHYPQIRVIQLPINRGAAAARNIGIGQARGQWIAFLDSDDQWLEPYLDHQLQALQRHPTAVLSYCNYIQMNLYEDKETRVKTKPKHSDWMLSLLQDCFIHSLSQVVVPRSVFERVGGFDERLKVCHDWEFYLRLFAGGTPVQVPKCLVRKHWIPGSLVTASGCQEWLADGLKLFDIFYANPENHRYRQWRQQAQRNLHVKVRQSQQYFAKIFEADALKNKVVANANQSPSTPPMPAPANNRKQVVSPLSQSGRSLCADSAHPSVIHPATHYTFTPDLWLMTAYFNPSHYTTKRVNYQHFKQRITAAGLKLLTVECAFGNAEFDLAGEPDVLQLRCADVMWQRERLINLALDRLPPQATKVAWIDCDLLFSNPNWAVDTVRLLDQFPVVQLFSQAIRLLQGQSFYDGTAEGHWHSFAAVHAQSPELARKGNAHKHGHTGFGWAARREIWQKHGLYDALIVGAADHLTAHAMCNDFESPCVQRHLGINPPQLTHFCNWGRNLHTDVQGRIGCVPGTVLHLWHGDLSDRQYVARHDKLAQFAFDPEHDIKIGQSGAWEWCSDKPELHQWLVDYFHQRQEDGE